MQGSGSDIEEFSRCCSALESVCRFLKAVVHKEARLEMRL